VDTRYLQGFVAVCEHGSFADAARRLNLTPAALAARIRSLEHDVGTALIARAGRRARPTEAGLRILERARELVKQARDLQAIANSEERLGELRLGVATSTLAELTPAVLEALYRLHPDLRIQVASGASSWLFGRVVSRDLDAALIVQPEHGVPKGFEWRAIKRERLVLIAPPGTPEDADPLRLLQERPLLRFDRELRGGQIAESWMRRNRIVPRERLEVDMLDTIAYLVAAGLGVALVPDWAPAWLARLGIVRLALPGRPPSRDMGVFWDDNGANVRLLRTIHKGAMDFVKQPRPRKG
jgi:DNA-binding transcriptional LysR family regulator